MKIDIIASNIGGMDGSNTQGKKPGEWAKIRVSNVPALLLLGTAAIKSLPLPRRYLARWYRVLSFLKGGGNNF